MICWMKLREAFSEAGVSLRAMIDPKSPNNRQGDMPGNLAQTAIAIYASMGRKFVTSILAHVCEIDILVKLLARYLGCWYRELYILILSLARLLAEVNEMAQASSIEWTESTWNPVTGCTKVSPGCRFCYAERMARRLQAMGQPRYRDGFELSLQEDLVELPLQWKTPRIIFVNSMSDLFHDKIPISFIQRCFSTMERAAHHTFQVLTKRPERAAELAMNLPWPDNVWLGTSVENQTFVGRVPVLSTIPAAIRFLSIEPLIGPISRLPLHGINWVIVGGESGPNARPMKADWATGIRDRCIRYDVPFFFKQWGGVQKSRTGRLLEGRTWDEMPSLSRRGNGKTQKRRSVA